MYSQPGSFAGLGKKHSNGEGLAPLVNALLYNRLKAAVGPDCSLGALD
jgi:hypothetical protein